MALIAENPTDLLSGQWGVSANLSFQWLVRDRATHSLCSAQLEQAGIGLEGHVTSTQGDPLMLGRVLHSSPTSRYGFPSWTAMHHSPLAR